MYSGSGLPQIVDPAQFIRDKNNFNTPNTISEEQEGIDDSDMQTAKDVSVKEERGRGRDTESENS